MWRARSHVCPGPQRFLLRGLLGLGMLVLIVMPRGELMAQPQAAVRAPAFPEGMQWLNTDRPLRLADLRGKVVLLDFWTYCCINCMYIIPERLQHPLGLAAGATASAQGRKALWRDCVGAGPKALPTAVAGFSNTSFGAEEVVQVAPQLVQAGAAGTILVTLHFPEGYHLNPRAPLHYNVSVSGEGIHLAEPDRQGQSIAPALPLAIPFQAAAGRHQATAAIDLTFYYCREDDTGVCAIQSVRWQVPLHTAPEGSASEVSVSYRAEAPVVQKQL